MSDTSLCVPRVRGEAPPRLEVADIFRLHGEAYRQTHVLTPEQHKAMRAIETCRTAVLGGHLDRCPKCSFERPSYNSCRNRHCPKCQALQQAEWIEERQQRILPTAHFHVVFTVPSELHPLALFNRELFFRLLFRTVSQTLLTLGEDPKRLGAQLGITAVLHTWTRDLRFHPHIHCIVTGGGLAQDGTRWLPARQRYLFPVKVLARLFRGQLLAALTDACEADRLRLPPELASRVAFRRLLNQLYLKEWVVFAKRPFGNAEHVVKYLGRYTHRIALSNQRLLSLDERGVRFLTRDGKSATLPPADFIERFLLHVLPRGFVKTRHFGLFAAKNVRTRLEQARALLSRRPAQNPPLAAPPSWREQMTRLTGIDPMLCPRCGETLERCRVLPLFSPPRPPQASSPGLDSS